MTPNYYITELLWIQKVFTALHFFYILLCYSFIPKLIKMFCDFVICILPLIRWSCPIPLAEKHPQSIKFPPPCFLGCCTQYLSSSKHGESSWCQIALFWSHLTTSPSPKPPPDHPGVLWQTSDVPVHVQDFNHSRCSVLLMVLFVTVVPTAFRSLTSFSCVALGWSLTFLIIIDIPQGEILRGAPDRGRLAVTLCFYHFLIITPTVVNFSTSCLLIFL